VARGATPGRHPLACQRPRVISPMVNCCRAHGCHDAPGFVLLLPDVVERDFKVRRVLGGSFRILVFEKGGALWSVAFVRRR
jgi:hypothetical protein